MMFCKCKHATNAQMEEGWTALVLRCRLDCTNRVDAGGSSAYLLHVGLRRLSRSHTYHGTQGLWGLTICVFCYSINIRACVTDVFSL